MCSLRQRLCRQPHREVTTQTTINPLGVVECFNAEAPLSERVVMFLCGAGVSRGNPLCSIRPTCGVQRPALWPLLSHSVQRPGVSGSDGAQPCSHCSALLWFVIHCQGRLRIPRHCHVTCRGMPLSFPVVWECRWVCGSPLLRESCELVLCKGEWTCFFPVKLVWWLLPPFVISHILLSLSSDGCLFFSLLLSPSLSVSLCLHPLVSLVTVFFLPSWTITDDGFLSKKQQAVACLQAVSHYLKSAVHSHFSKGTEHYAGALK